MKKLIAFILCTIILICAITPVTHAESGEVDLYEAFSNNNEMYKTEVGSSIYKWSMYLPDDAEIRKSEKVNNFSMTTTNYQASINLLVDKNTQNLTLEDILYSMQNNASQDFYSVSGNQEFQFDISKDAVGNRYIKIVETRSYSDLYSLDISSAINQYVESRIYIANGNIYLLTVQMNEDFYKQHIEMFNKLTSSFKMSFDAKNPNIKELTDLLSTVREYKNTSYGWKIKLSPYWKEQGKSNSREQVFRPVYSDEELNQDSSDNKEYSNEISEGIRVNLVSSSTAGETAAKWAQKDIDSLKNNYNSKVFDIISNGEYSQNGLNVYSLVIRIKTDIKNPYLIQNLYVIGNGYKYLVTAVMMDDKFIDKEKKDKFDFMLKSFTLDKSCLSKYIGKIVLAEDVMNLNEPKELKLEKYNFSTKINKGWNNNSSDYSYTQMRYLLPMIDEFEDFDFIRANDPDSSISLNNFAGKSSLKLKELISQIVAGYIDNEEIRSGLAKVNISSASSTGATIYKIAKEYDINEIEKYVKEDDSKSYDYEYILNEYTYIIEAGKNTYIQDILIPVANTSDVNLKKIDNLWKNTIINEVNYSSLNLKWAQHSLAEFKLDKKASEKEDY